MTDIKLWLLYSNTWNYLTVYKKNSGSFMKPIYIMYLQIIFTFEMYVLREFTIK